MRDREFENGDGIGDVAAGEQLNLRDWYSGPEESDTLLVKMRITDTEEALVQRVLVTEGGFELEDYRGFPEMGHGLLAGRDRAKGLPVGTHAEALRQAHTRLAKDPDVTL
ncbi:hypothetical protein [Kocuria sp. CH-021]|uniref:hypothetical protein n=1 Tax=Kocuria sp. CH-021 TaxID=3406735 RepID=UPI003C74489B